MSWLLLAFFSMLAKSAQNFFEKKSQNQSGAFLTFFLMIVISSVVVLPFVLFTPIPIVNLSFWIGILGSVVIYMLAKPMRLFAIGTGDLSEIIPLISLSSLFSLIFGWLFLKEVPNSWGIIGVSLVAVGGYMMNFDMTQVGFINKVIHPVRFAFSNKTQTFLYLSLLLGPITSVFDKFAINNTFPKSPSFALIMENLFIIPLLIPVLFARKISVEKLKYFPNWKVPLLLGLTFGISNILNFLAISVGNIGYVAAIRQLSSLISVLMGYFILKEGKLGRCLLSAIVMGIGAFLVGYLG